MSRGSFVAALTRSKVFRFLRSRREQYLSTSKILRQLSLPSLRSICDRISTRTETHAADVAFPTFIPEQSFVETIRMMYAVINERQRYDRYRSTKINEFHACFLEPRCDRMSRNERRRRDDVFFRGPFTARRSRGASESSSRTCFSYHRSNWKTISTHRVIYARLYAAFGICVFNKFIREIATLPRRVNRSACFLIA